MEIRSLKNKKGQVSTIAPAVIGLLLAGLILILGLIILGSLRDSNVLDQANSAEVVNETIDTTSATAPAEAPLQPGFGNFAPSIVINVTDDEEIALTNFTLDNQANTIIFSSGADDAHLNLTTHKVTYSYTFGGTSWTAANQTLTGNATFADFWEIIVLAVVTMVVIGLLLTVFGGRRER